MVRSALVWLFVLSGCLSETPVATPRGLLPDSGAVGNSSTFVPALVSEGSGAIIVKYTADGIPCRCWLATGVFVEVIDHQLVQWGTYQGNRVQITAPFAVVTVPDDAWGDAFVQLGISRETCLALNRSVYLPNKGWILPADENEPPPAPLMPRAKKITVNRRSGRIRDRD